MSTTQEVTRAELVRALAAIGIHVAPGNGFAGMHRAASASIVGVDMAGTHRALNGERNPEYVSLVVQVVDPLPAKPPA